MREVSEPQAQPRLIRIAPIHPSQVRAGAGTGEPSASEAAVGPPSDTLTVNTAVTLYEEEISDVSLSTFYVFDHENAGARRPGATPMVILTMGADAARL